MGGSACATAAVVSAGDGSLTVVATPGHTPDHVAFHAKTSAALFTGDAVLGRGTSVIDPPEGDLIAYLHSLRRMRELAPERSTRDTDPPCCRRSRSSTSTSSTARRREAQVLAALAEGPRTPEEIVPEIYGSYPSEVHELAARSVLAHLLKLEVEGRVEKRTKGGVTRWSRIEPRACERCGRTVRGRTRLCGSCSLAVLQE